MTPVWFLIGAGWKCKTTLARWLGGEIAGAGVRRSCLPLSIRKTAASPPSSTASNSPPRTTRRRPRAGCGVVGFLIEQRVPAVLDLGGGDTALASLLTIAPGFAGAMEEAGVAPVAAFLLGPRVDDLAVMQSLRARGFRPRASAIILNEGRVDQGLTREEAFARVLKHSAFRAAVEDGAAVIWMPRLDPPDLAQDIEAKRLHFTDARDGIVPEGRKIAPITALERVMVRAWLERMDQRSRPCGPGCRGRADSLREKADDGETGGHGPIPSPPGIPILPMRTRSLAPTPKRRRRRRRRASPAPSRPTPTGWCSTGCRSCWASFRGSCAGWSGRDRSRARP